MNVFLFFMIFLTSFFLACFMVGIQHVILWMFGPLGALPVQGSAEGPPPARHSPRKQHREMCFEPSAGVGDETSFPRGFAGPDFGALSSRLGPEARPILPEPSGDTACILSRSLTFLICFSN